MFEEQRQSGNRGQHRKKDSYAYGISRTIGYEDSIKARFWVSTKTVS